MRFTLLLLLCTAVFTLSGQTLRTEDILLRQRVVSGDLSPERYAYLGQKLRDAVNEVGGYPMMPLDTQGNYRYTTRITTDLNPTELSSLIRQWLALGSFEGANRYGYDGPDRLIHYVETPYIFSGQGRELLPVLHGSPNHSTVGCTMEVTFEAGGITITLSDPLFFDRYEYVTEHYEGVTASARERTFQVSDLLPLVANDHKWYEWRLRRAKLIHDCVEGMVESLSSYLAAAESR